MTRPVVWLAIFFSMGIALQYALNIPILILFAAAVVLIVFVAFCLAGKRSSAGIIVFLTIISGSLWLALTDRIHASQLVPFEGKRLDLCGSVVGQPERLQDKVLCDLLVDRFKLGKQQWQEVSPERVRVYFFSEENTADQGQKLEDLAYGDYVTAHGKLVLPRQKRNPREFDYRQYLKFRNIHTLLYVYQDGQVVVDKDLTGSPVNRIIAATLRIREDFSAAVHAKLPERQAVILLAMLFGEQRAVYEEDMEMFRETGIAHALSVSGFHVGLVLLLILMFCSYAQLNSRMTVIASAFALCGYCALSAFTVTVVRASIMGVIGLLAHHLDRERSVYNALAVSGLSILIWNPYFLFDPGFQLSFAAVWAMAYLDPFLRDLLPDILYGFGSAVTIPAAAQLGTIPILAWHFNIVSPLAIVANILLVPVMSGIVIIGLIAFLSFRIPFLSGIFLQPSGFLIETLVTAGDIIAKLPVTVFFVAPPPVPVLFLYYGLVMTSVELWSGRLEVPWLANMSDPHNIRQKVSVIVLFCALLPIVINGGGSGDLRIFFLDVGQGDAIFIQGPSGNTALVDGGGVPEYFGQGYAPGKDTVLPFLHGQGVNSLDLIINSHPDQDHLDGLLDVLEEMPVSQVMTSPVEGWEDKFDPLLKTACDKGVTHTVLSKGAEIKLDKEVVIKVLAPNPSDKYATSNDASLVLQVCHGNNSFLLLGDLEEEGIRKLLSEGNKLHSSLIKIPHHGARGSYNETLYKESGAAIAVISVGQNNPFGHPSQQVVDYWQASGAVLFRTDVNGCVTVISDGHTCRVQTIH